MNAAQARKIADNNEANKAKIKEFETMCSNIINLIHIAADKGAYEIVLNDKNVNIVSLAQHLYQLLYYFEQLGYKSRSKCTKGMEIDGYVIIDWRGSH